MIQIEIDDEVEFKGGQKANIIKEKDSLATITLADCLACSGCVTTAETMLIQQHSVEQVLKLLQDDGLCVLSFSRQSLASLSLFYKIPLIDIFKILSSALTQHGFH